MMACTRKHCLKEGYWWLAPPLGTCEVTKYDGHLTQWQWKNKEDKVYFQLGVVPLRLVAILILGDNFERFAERVSLASP